LFEAVEKRGGRGGNVEKKVAVRDKPKFLARRQENPSKSGRGSQHDLGGGDLVNTPQIRLALGCTGAGGRQFKKGAN